jgi:hypothetical protein
MLTYADVGVGFDTDFERALLAHTACTIFSFDPTPAVVHHMRQVRA